MDHTSCKNRLFNKLQMTWRLLFSSKEKKPPSMIIKQIQKWNMSCKIYNNLYILFKARHYALIKWWINFCFAQHKLQLDIMYRDTQRDVGKFVHFVNGTVRDRRREWSEKCFFLVHFEYTNYYYITWWRIHKTLTATTKPLFHLFGFVLFLLNA